MLKQRADQVNQEALHLEKAVDVAAVGVQRAHEYEDAVMVLIHWVRVLWCRDVSVRNLHPGRRTNSLCVRSRASRSARRG